MDTRWPLIRTAAVVGLAILFAPGCLFSRKSSQKNSFWPTSFQEMVPFAAPEAETPVAEIGVAWQNYVAYLPDPTKDGKMSPGLAGDVFLFGPGLKKVSANGVLTVDLYDETKGTGENAPLVERWQFDKETLKSLVTHDEMLGRKYTIFLPWPDYKPSSNKVRLKVKYEPVTGHPLYALDAQVTLDPVNKDGGQPKLSGNASAGFGPAR